MNLLLLLSSSTSFTPSSLPNLALWLDPTPGTAQGTTAGSAASFPGTTGNNLSAPDNVTLQTTGFDFWVAGWFNLSSLASTNQIVAKGGLSASSSEYGVSVNTSGGISFRYGNGSGGSSVISSVTVSTGTWYFFLASFNQSTLQSSIYVNNLSDDLGSSAVNPVANAAVFKIGAYATSGSCSGLVDSVAFGKVAAGTITGLKSAISASLHNSGAGKNYANLTSGEKTAWGLQSFWDLQDTTWVDSHGTNNLSQNGTVSLGTGITQVPTTISYGCFKDGAASFANNTANYLSVASNSTLQTGDIDFTLAACVNFSSLSAAATGQGWLGKWTGSTNYEYNFFYNNTTNRLSFGVSSAGTAGTIVTVTADNFGALSANTWYLVVGRHDSVNNTISISVNAGTPNSGAHSLGVFASSAALRFGTMDSVDARPLSGSIDSVGFWKRCLTDAEITALYNGGAGLNYSDLSNSIKTNLVSWWNLDETTGTRFDSHGSNHLTMNGTVGWSAGIASSLCGDGDPVSKWVARTGQVFAAPSVSSRPTYKSNSGKPYLLFDGVDDGLRADFSPVGYPLSAFVGVNPKTFSAYAPILFTQSTDATSNATFRMCARTSSAPWGTYGSSGGDQSSGTTLAAGTSYALGMTIPNGSGIFYTNGASDGAFASTIGNSTGTGIVNRWNVGCEEYPFGSLSRFLNGGVGHVVVYSRVLSATAANSVSTFIQARMP